ncbi:GNAT family N-acetyltransferase [Vibrio cortegadensis]|uniref:GNAT family N-acetyltransferase n=1 Tax=Vibrio cortegadensis TaxID=1328770 RepID=UPI0021C3132D|nr:GNAT family N-acetyltransferase [Vibrio cortegadensis]MDN3698334.1 GNAT family N-acetyltransferase [Vibrio cortegadensis]
MHSIEIRAAVVTDLDDLNDLMFDLHDHHHQACPEHFKTAEDIEQEKSIARYLDDPECVVYVAKQGDEIIGFITGHFCELVSTVSKPVPMGSVDELYVVPEFRQLQIAQKLFEHIEVIFEQYGVKQMFVEVWEFNQSAQHFYQKMGFTHHIQWMRKAIGKSTQKKT